MRRSRPSAAALALVAAAALTGAGCGGDDEDEQEPGPAAGAPARTAPPPVTTPPAETTPPPGEPAPQGEAPEVPPQEQQGDEEPIRSEAVFTGRGGELRPREVRVPAFIAVRVVLRSGDGRPYSLRIGGERLHVDGERRIDQAELAGLLPDARYEGSGPQGRVRIVPTAEPGP